MRTVLTCLPGKLLIGNISRLSSAPYCFPALVVSPAPTRFKSSHTVKPRSPQGSRFASPSQPAEQGKHARHFQTPVVNERSTRLPELSSQPIYPDICLDPVRTIPDHDLSSTRPAPLNAPNSPTAGPDGSVPVRERASYLFQLGKAYLTFYKTGLKNTWSNYKQSRQIRQNLNGFSLIEAAAYGGEPIRGHTTDKVAPLISRKEFQLVLRSRHDVKKLVPFSLVFAICGEFTPLVIVLLGSRVVPYTCRIPKQATYDHERPHRIRDTCARAAESIRDLEARNEDGDVTSALGSEARQRARWLRAYELGISSFATPPPIVGAIWSRQVQSNLTSRGAEILADMILIRREGGYAKLEPIEVFNCAIKNYNKECVQKLLEMRDAGSECDPDSKELKDRLVPILEQTADRVFSLDFKQLDPKTRALVVLE